MNNGKPRETEGGRELDYLAVDRFLSDPVCARALEAAFGFGLIDRLIQAYEIPTQSCVLAHVTTQLAALERGAPVDLVFQSIAGSEAAGVVTALGTGVTTLRVGDRVAYAPVMGAYAEYAAIPADRLIPLPASLDARTAAAVTLQGMTAHYPVKSP